MGELVLVMESPTVSDAAHLADADGHAKTGWSSTLSCHEDHRRGALLVVLPVLTIFAVGG